MSHSRSNAPPRLLLRFFRWFCHPDFQEDIEGDLHELFERKVGHYGKRKAKWLFALDVLKLFRPGIIRNLEWNYHLNNYGMFKNYFLTALRNIRKEKAFALMNIAGLALGIGCGIVIYQIITYELSYDTHHRNYRNIYRLINEYNHPSEGIVYFPGQVHPLGEALRNDFPGLEAAMTFYAAEGQVSVERKDGTKDRFQESAGLAFAEPNIFKIFDFNFLTGDPATALANTGSVVLTAALAQKYFKLPAEEVHEALGSFIILENKATLVVTGVIADPPGNTDLPFKILANYKDQPASNPYFNKGTDWNEYNSNTQCYILLSDGISPSKLERELPNFLLKYLGKERAVMQKYVLQPLIELHSSDKVANYNNHIVTEGRLIALAIIGLFLILTASINFINLSTAQAIKRSKEIGVRKTLGGHKRQLIFQYLGETILISFIAAFGGLVIAQLLFVYLENIIGYKLSLEHVLNPGSILFMTGLVLAVGLLSGLYPSTVMARMNPVLALKNTLAVRQTSGLLSIRRTLVIAQFVISQVLIIATIVVHLQMDYFSGKDLGFNKDAVLISKLPNGASPEKLQLLKSALQQNASIQMVSLGVSPLAGWRVGNAINHPSLNKDEHMGNLKTADEDYLDLYQLKLIAGRNYGTAKSYEDAIVNRKLTRLLGFENPSEALDEKFKYGDGLEFKIIGVVEDFHAASLHEGMDHVILANVPFNIREVAVKLNTTGASLSDIQNTINGIKNEWDKVFPDVIFDYIFYDEQINQMYNEEQRTAQLFHLFAVIAIFIGCLGLYALISYVANQKTKEIGVRKVLGASAYDIQLIFTKEMFVLILVAFAIAGPLAYLAMNSWLEEFAYRIPFSPIVFVVAILVSMVIAAATISYKSISASLANPVLSLKNE